MYALQEGRTALMFASMNSYADVVRVLLENGADPLVKDQVSYS